MKSVVFDLESNGLLDTITKVWVIAAKDMQSGRKYVFTDEDCDFGNINGNLEQGVRFLMQYDKIIAHNIMGYDYIVLEKFFPKIWNRKTVPFSKIWDTFIQSKCQIFDRPRIKGTASLHGLEYYGVLFKRPKPPIEDWSYFDEEKLHRVIEDIEINAEAYNYLNKEADKIGLDFTKAIRRTQASSYWYAKQELYGTKGDLEHMKKCVEELDILTEELRQEVEPLLPKQLKVKSTKCTWQDISNKWERFYRRVPKTQYDNEGKVIKPAYMPTLRVKLKSGLYDKHTANHFDIPVDPVMSNDLVGGEYTKIEYLEPKMSQHQVIKDYLLSIGWIPTQFNYEKGKDGSYIRDSKGKLIEKSPKLTEDSFDSIEGEVGQKIAKYNTYMHRRRTFLNDKDDSKGWINQLRSDGRIASGCMPFSTSTGRAVQRNICNVPSPSALYGAEMRKAWVAEKGYKLVSVDMDSAQLRILANFMGDPVYTDAVLTGMEFDNDGNYVGTDPHTINAQAFGVMSPDMVIEARETQDQKLIKTLSDIRKYSKNGIYAYLFGSGDLKLATTLKMRTAADGKKIKEDFANKLPAMAELQERLRKQFRENKYGRGGFIEVAGNTYVYCMSEHKLLNYLLMGSEAVLQNEAVCWLNVQTERRGIIGGQILSIHDELTGEYLEEDVPKAVGMMSEMYGAASKRIGLEVLVTGTAKFGDSWYDVH
jgi:hypothetical protein